MGYEFHHKNDSANSILTESAHAPFLKQVAQLSLQILNILFSKVVIY